MHLKSKQVSLQQLVFSDDHFIVQMYREGEMTVMWLGQSPSKELIAPNFVHNIFLSIYSKCNVTFSFRETYNLDISRLEWDEFFTNLVLGVRRYLHREELKTLPAARRKNAVLFVLNCLIQLSAFSGIWYLVALFANTSMTSVLWVLPLSYSLFSII